MPPMNVDAVRRVKAEGRPLAKVAKAMGAESERGWDAITHTFPDGTRLVVRGRGRNYRVEYEFE